MITNKLLMKNASHAYGRSQVGKGERSPNVTFKIFNLTTLVGSREIERVFTTEDSAYFSSFFLQTLDFNNFV